MVLTPEQKNAIISASESIVKQSCFALATYAIANGVKSLVVASRKKQSLTGSETTEPTTTTSNLAEKDTSGNRSEQALAQQNTTAANEEVQASDTSVNAINSDAQATNASANAVSSEAGATEASTQGLKLN